MLPLSMMSGLLATSAFFMGSATTHVGRVFLGVSVGFQRVLVGLCDISGSESGFLGFWWVSMVPRWRSRGIRGFFVDCSRRDFVGSPCYFVVGDGIY